MAQSLSRDTATYDLVTAQVRLDDYIKKEYSRILGYSVEIVLGAAISSPHCSSKLLRRGIFQKDRHSAQAGSSATKSTRTTFATIFKRHNQTQGQLWRPCARYHPHHLPLVSHQSHLQMNAQQCRRFIMCPERYLLPSFNAF